MEVITFVLNGQALSARAGKTILEVARENGLAIPTLCHHELLRPIGACRLCQVEDKKRNLVVPSCVTAVGPGMVIETDSPRVRRNRRNIVRLLLAAHPESCLVCEKGNLCQLRKLAAQLGVGGHNLDRLPYHPGVMDLNPVLCRDLSKCILCGKCIRADQEVVVEGVIDYNKRGFDGHPATLFSQPLEQSQCTLCGTCLASCPTGALQEKGKPRLGHAGARTESVCSFCACGCSIYVEHNHLEILGVSPTARPDTANGLSLCVKGHFGHDFLSSPERLRTPLLRTPEGFQPIAWDRAIDLAAARFREILAADGPESLGFIGGSRSTNEEAYLFQKLAREVIGTGNVDSLSNLTWGRAAGVLAESAGRAAGSGSLKDLEQSDLILVAGADPSQTAPVLAYHLKRAVRFRGGRLILLDPRETRLAPLAQVWLRPALAADAPALAGLIKAALEAGPLQAGAGPAGDLRARFEAVSVAECGRLAGLAEEDLRRAGGLVAGARRMFIVFGAGLTLQPAAGELVRLVLDLVRLAAALGQEPAGWLPLLKDCNAQGAWDMGLAPGFRPGLDVRGMAAAAAQGRLAGLYVLAENPLGVLPGPAAVREALGRLKFLLVQDLFLTETASLAHLVLPAAGFPEKDGTVTNLEGRIQRLRQALPPPGDFPAEWRVLAELAGRLGQAWPYRSPADVQGEIEIRVPTYSGLSGAGAAGTGFLTPPAGERPRPGGRRETLDLTTITGATGATGATGRPGQDGYPFVLMPGHILPHLGSGARTARSPRLGQVAPGPYFSLSPADLSRLGLRPGEVVRAVSAHGSLEGPVRQEASLPPGLVFAPASFPGWRPGVLFAAEADNLKHCRVRLEKVA